MDNAGKLALFGGVALSVLFISRAVGKASQPPIEETALERQVMRHKDLIWRMAVKYDADPALIAAIMAKESSGISRAPRSIVVTDRGILGVDYVAGLMQVRLDTAKAYCNIGAIDFLEPNEANVECGVKYFRAMLDRFRSVPPAVSAYNAGPGNVGADPSMIGGRQYVNLAYIRAVLEMVQRFRLLFMSWKGANAYMSVFPHNKWRFEIP